MYKRRKSFLTVIVIPHSTGEYKSYRLSSGMIGSGLYASLTLLVCLVFFFASYSNLRGEVQDFERLRLLTLRQEQQIRILSSRASELDREVERARDLNEQVRDLLASQRWEVTQSTETPWAKNAGTNEASPKDPSSDARNFPNSSGSTSEALAMGSASYTMPNEADASSQRNDTPMYRIRSGSISRDGFPRMELLKEYEKQGEKTHPEIVTAKILLDEVEACVDGVVDDLEDLADTLRNRKDFQQAQPTIKPVNGRVTSRFGWRRSPFGRYREFHGGIDIAAPTGTTVRASGDGMVVFSGRKGALGLTVIVDHGYGYLTYYGHNSKNLVKTGERVEKGQAIARVGASGRTTGPHVHYEIHYKGSRVDPLTLMKE